VQENIRSGKYDIDTYYDHHHGKGHHICKCIALKHPIQDMIDDGILPIQNVAKPNNQTNT